MVVIRLSRTGKKKQAFYRIVVADSRKAVTAKFVQIVGWYNPHSKEINLKTDEVKDWLAKGAKPSNSVAVLLKNEGIKLPDWVQIKEKVRKPKKVVEEKPAAKEPVKEEEAVEAVEETQEENTEAEVETEAPAENEAEGNAPEADAEVSAE